MPSEAAVKNHFRAYKRLLVAAVGRGPMDDAKINEIGKLEFGTVGLACFHQTKRKNFCGCETGSLLRTLLQAKDAARTGSEST